MPFATKLTRPEKLMCGSQEYTRTGYFNNHFAMGSAILWMPFLIVAHLGGLVYNLAGGHVAADGFSLPYLTAMALGTATCVFAGLFLAHRVAPNHFGERWVFLATSGIWFASPLPIYMYFNPSYSHAASIFSVPLFIFYWGRTRERRSGLQWLGLGLCSFQTMVRAQCTSPVRLKDALLKYPTHRNAMMNQIESIDVQQIREQERREHPYLP